VPEAQDLFWLGFIASLLAASGTVVGAAAAFFLAKTDARTEDALLSAAAGVMLAATFFSLLLPAIERAEAQLGSRILAIAIVAGGLLLGAITMLLAHRHTPHEHFILGKEGPEARSLERVWLFVIAISLHNLPEGMAVGVGFAGTDIGNGISLAIGIGVQNVPEGLAVAAAMIAIGYPKTRGVLGGVSDRTRGAGWRGAGKRRGLAGRAPHAMDTRLGRGSDAFRDQRRNHSGDAPEGVREHRDLRLADRVCTDDVSGRRVRVTRIRHCRSAVPYETTWTVLACGPRSPCSSAKRTSVPIVSCSKGRPITLLRWK